MLTHAQDVLQAPAYKHASHDGPEVQQALLLLWNAANRICAKRLIPFLPTLIASLERHGHVRLTEEIRSQLLSMSAATADRLLRSQRTTSSPGLSPTKAGTLLKQQIPIRPFEEWKQTRPGFWKRTWWPIVAPISREAPCTRLSLTDVATGWTEWLPILHRREVPVLVALQRARMLFPFPILGIDTDTGGEFINEVMVAYCEQEHITFPRGRPSQKRDQCFVEVRRVGAR